jgi:hypothetical protein
VGDQHSIHPAKNIRIQGIYVGSREMFEAMNRAIALHQLQPVIDRVFPFESAHEALVYLRVEGTWAKSAFAFKFFRLGFINTLNYAGCGAVLHKWQNLHNTSELFY